MVSGCYRPSASSFLFTEMDRKNSERGRTLGKSLEEFLFPRELKDHESIYFRNQSLALKKIQELSSNNKLMLQMIKCLQVYVI